MLKVLAFIYGIWNLNSRLTEEEHCQVAEGYSIRRVQEGPESCTYYVEGEREASILAEFSYLNDVVVYTDSFRKWTKPYGEPVSDFEFAKIRSRAIRYFECWGGEVSTNDMTLKSDDDLKAEVEQAGIPYEELPGGVIHYSIDIDEERKRKGGFFNQ